MPAGSWSDVYAADGTKLLDTLAKQFNGILSAPVSSYAAAGAITPGKGGVVIVDVAGSTAMTLTAPTPGELLLIYTPGAGAVTVTLAAGTWDGTNDVATFSQGDYLLVYGVSATRYLQLVNVGSVAYS